MPKPRAAAPSNGRERALILLVDDEALLRSATARLLRRERYDVLTAADGEEALEVFDGCDPPPALVVLDLEMPRKSGAEAFRELRARCPDQSVLLISGHTSADVEGLLADGAIGFLAKPFENDTLLAAVASAVTDPAQPTDAATAS